MNPCVLFDRDGTLVELVPYLNHSSQLQLIPGTTQAIRRLNERGIKVAVVTNQPVIAKEECTLEELERIHELLKEELSKGEAFVDKIYFCPHFPQGTLRGFNIRCKCRKPETGMVMSALQELGADPNKTWLVGDTTVDIQTAQNAQLRSILVRTGYGGTDSKYPNAKATLAVQDVVEAVEHILGNR